MISKSVVKLATKLHRSRTRAKLDEVLFSIGLASDCRATRGDNKKNATDLGISAQYLNDVVNGRRTVSDSVIEKIMGLSK